MRTTLKSILLRIAVSFLSFWSSRTSIEFCFRYPGILPYQKHDIMSKFDFILSVFPHRTTEDITEKYPREPEMRDNCTLTSPVCKEICSTSFPRVSKYGKELHHLLALPATEKRGYFLHRKNCLIFADHSNCIRGISSD